MSLCENASITGSKKLYFELLSGVLKSRVYTLYPSLSSVFEVYQLIESTLNLKEATLSTDIPYLTIKEGFEKACPETSINDAKKDLPALNDAW